MLRALSWTLTDDYHDAVLPGGLRVRRRSEEAAVSLPLPQTDPSKCPVKIVGVGGCGCNSITRLGEMGIIGADLIRMETAAQYLLDATSGRKVLLGRTVCRGVSAKSSPKLGEKAAVESTDSIREALQGSEIVFILCGLGGGTGTGASPVVARIADSLGAMSVVLCTMPFANEGQERAANATRSLKVLMRDADLLMVSPNDRLVEAVPKMSLNAAFALADDWFIRTITGLTEGYVTTERHRD